MIRLSCWVGVVGCAIGVKALASEPEDMRAQVVPVSPVKRFVQADVDGSGSLSREEFANAAPKLERYFHLVDMDGDGEANLDEILEAWQKYKERLRAKWSTPKEAPPPADEERRGCVSEPC